MTSLCMYICRRSLKISMTPHDVLDPLLTSDDALDPFLASARWLWISI